ncbi:MAG TPA: hypothetical protein PKV75_03740 [Desulfobacterales bacterium]|nr:hypothetical protein [Desulfobacterales bacterium]
MRKKAFFGIVCCILIPLFSPLSWAENNRLELSNEDCVKCHLEQVREVNQRGALHQTEVGCIDCHQEHLPHGKNTVSKCDACHTPQDKPHYQLDNCIACHHPHYPREMDFAKIENIKPVCLSCHPEPGREMEQFPSEHVGFDCKECHTQHHEATGCMECHDSHTPEMTQQDCSRCHKPHRPSAIKYDDVVPSSLCSSCHETSVKDISDRGAAHKEVACIQCHQQHPPSEKGVIPSCAMCHTPQDKPHYQLDNCIACHHPHYPREMDFAKIENIKPVCLSCHPEPGREMEQFPSEHVGFDCKECHTQHHEATGCMECHDSHTPEMTQQDCSRCHKPHMPMKVTYVQDIPSSFCKSCHEPVSKDLEENKTKHHQLGCAYCHMNEHKASFDCETCHGQPHGFDIHARYPDCIKCHRSPHALVR